MPFWTKDEVAAERIRTQTLNARAETIHQKPSFRASIMTKRCLVLVDGFYEWREEGKKKYPYYISLASNDAFALAGIWDRWLNNSTGEVKDTFSIITTRANPLLERIHNTTEEDAGASFTMDTYQHIMNGMQKDAVALLDGVLPAGVCAGSRPEF